MKKPPKKRITPDDFEGLKKVIVSIYVVIRFFISNSDSLMDTNTQRLYTFEPENDKVNKCVKYIKKIIFFSVALFVSTYVVFTNVHLLGETKS